MTANGPLAGVRVLELGTVLMVPFAGQILGDLGAEIVKVESFVGDPNRQVGSGAHPDLSGVSLNLNRNKRSLALDLARAEGRSALGRLVATCDVFMTNLRPQALAKLSLRYEDLSAERPDLVYCRSHGFASASGDADLPAYDDIIQAASGIASLSIHIDGVPRLLPTVFADKVTGLTIAYAILAALFDRQRSGIGHEVEVPMFDTMLAFTLVEHLGGATMIPPLGPPGYGRLLNPHRRPHQTSDGWIVLMPYSAMDWRRIWLQLQDDEFTQRLNGLTEHQVKSFAPEMYERLSEHLVSGTTQHWLQFCSDLDIAASAVPNLEDIVKDGGSHRGVLEPQSHSVVGSYLRIRPPAHFSGFEGAYREAPLIGQDSVDILAELGYAHAEIQELVRENVVRTSAKTTGRPSGEMS
jgi:crotonobetainyl-CoA:carnitine CoA-transferase CaiB-like acyl-CoA transferase